MNIYELILLKETTILQPAETLEITGGDDDKKDPPSTYTGSCAYCNSSSQ